MSLFYRCAVQRSSRYATMHCSRRSLSLPTNVHQLGLLRLHAFSLRTESPPTYGVMGRRCFASKKIYVLKPSRKIYVPKPSRKTPKPSARAEALAAPSREQFDRNKDSSNDIDSTWVGVAAIYAVLLVITWGGTTVYWLRLIEEAPITGRRRFAYYSVPASSSKVLPDEVVQQVEEIQRQIGPLSAKVRQVFRNIAVAAGVDDREWKVYTIPDSGQSSHINKPIIYVV